VSDVSVIVNPAAGRGSAARRIDEIRAAFAAVGIGRLLVTARAGEELTLARAEAERGVTTIAAVGGDGTWSNVARGIIEAGADCRLAILAAGTGNDFAKSANVPATDLVLSARLAADGPDRRVDVGTVDGRIFLNVAGCGFDVAVLERVARSRWFRGNALYVSSALTELFGFRGAPIEVVPDHGASWRDDHLLLAIANGRRFGAAFTIAPKASLTDGLLDAVAILNARVPARLRLLAAASAGRHLELPGVRSTRAAGFTLRFPNPPALELDGEYFQAERSELRVECRAGALRLVGVA
jgi:diacylglycerol kinase (ATP)